MIVEEECEEENVGSHLNLYKRESKHRSKGPIIEHSKLSKSLSAFLQVQQPYFLDS